MSKFLYLRCHRITTNEHGFLEIGEYGEICFTHAPKSLTPEQACYIIKEMTSCKPQTMVGPAGRSLALHHNISRPAGTSYKVPEMRMTICGIIVDFARCVIKQVPLTQFSMHVREWTSEHDGFVHFRHDR